MVKLATFFLVFLLSCAGPAHSTDSKAREPRRQWSKKLDGLVSDLNISSSGSSILVALSPDFESAQGPRHYQLAFLNSAGDVLWKVKPDAPIREQALAADGSWAVFSSYDDHLTAIDTRSGKKLWTTDGTCRPTIFSSSRKILCYHDDDADSTVAFDVYSGEGRKLLSFPIAADSLGLKISLDQKYFVLALTRGQVILFNSEFRALWQTSLPGEIVDFDVSSGRGGAKVAVLTRDVHMGKERKSSLIFLDGAGRSAGERMLSFVGRKVSFFPDGSQARVLIQGLEKGRQLATLISEADGVKISLKEEAALDQTLKVDTVIPLVMGASYFVLQDDSLTLKSFDMSGKAHWKIPVAVEGESTLYAQAFAWSSGSLVLANDRGELSFFKIDAE